MTEFDLIRTLSSRFPATDGIVGIGDDCAVIPGDEEDLLVTTDLLAEGVHFLFDRISPYDLGWKSAAVNISDIAAMGGTPRHAFLSIALPPSVIPGSDRESPSSWLDSFSDGFADSCHRFGVTLLGGDTSASKGGIFINVTLIGSCPRGTALLRSGARPGDLICVTGTLGDSAAGLRLLQECDGPGDSSAPLRSGRNDREMPDRVGHDEWSGHEETVGTAAPGGHDEMPEQVGHDEAYLLQRHFRPEPRVAEGQALRQCPGVHAMMDVSDGVAADLPHILEASGGLGATVDVATLPLSPQLRRLCASRGWDPVDLALCGGEDYELLFTLAPNALPPVACTVIGTVEAAPGLTWQGGRSDYSGFRHF